MSAIIFFEGMEMKKTLLTMMAALLLGSAVSDTTVIRAEEADTVRIVFTGDLYDHITPLTLRDENGEAKLYGGYAYIATAMEEYRNADSLLLDAGNFSIGSYCAELNASKAPDLTMMSMMGYDAVALGYEDIMQDTQTVTDMLKTAEDMPLLLSANLNIDSADLKEEWKDKGTSSKIFEKKGHKIGVFAVASEGKHDALSYTDPAAAAASAVSELKQQGAEIIVCLLSSPDASLDQAMSDAGADILISTAGGRRLAEAETLGSTTVVSCGSYGKEFAVLDYDIKEHSVKGYSLHEVASSSLAPYGSMVGFMQSLQADVSARVFGQFGYSWSDPVAYATVPMTGAEGEGKIADFIAEAYQDAYQRAPEDAKPVLSILTRLPGTIDFKGKITVNSLYNSLGARSPLIRVYISGKDLRALCEMDYKIYEDGGETSLTFGKMKYMYSPRRTAGNMIEYVYVEAVRGYYIPANDDTLYPVVSDLYLPEVIEQIAAKAGMENTIKLCDASGTPVTDLTTMEVITDGKVMYPWAAGAAYLKGFERGAMDLPEIGPDYMKTKVKREEDRIFNFVRYFRHLDFSVFLKYVYWAAGAVILAIVLKIAVWIVNRKPAEKRS